MQRFHAYRIRTLGIVGWSIATGTRARYALAGELKNRSCYRTWICSAFAPGYLLEDIVDASSHAQLVVLGARSHADLSQQAPRVGQPRRPAPHLLARGRRPVTQAEPAAT